MQRNREQHQQSSCTRSGMFGKSAIKEPLKDPHMIATTPGARPDQRRNRTRDKSYRVPLLPQGFYLVFCLYAISYM
jgi:hypothetical protein